MAESRRQSREKRAPVVLGVGSPQQSRVRTEALGPVAASLLQNRRNRRSSNGNAVGTFDTQTFRWRLNHKTSDFAHADAPSVQLRRFGPVRRPPNLRLRTLRLPGRAKSEVWACLPTAMP